MLQNRPHSGGTEGSQGSTSPPHFTWRDPVGPGAEGSPPAPHPCCWGPIRKYLEGGGEGCWAEAHSGFIATGKKLKGSSRVPLLALGRQAGQGAGVPGSHSWARHTAVTRHIGAPASAVPWSIRIQSGRVCSGGQPAIQCHSPMTTPHPTSHLCPCRNGQS